MGNTVKSRTRRIGLFIAMLFATAFMAPSAASAVDAPPVGTPGPTTMEITGGFLKVGSTLEAPLNEEDLPTRPSFDATIGADGSLFVPKSGFHFPHLVFPVEDVPIIGDLDIGIDIIPTHDVTGQIDPESGAVSLFMRFKIKATTSGLADVGSNCTIGTDAAPLTLNMSTATGIDPSATPGLSLGGIPYNPDTGAARVADKSFTAPAHTGCTGLAAGQINSLLGLPSPAGQNSGEFSLAFTPKVLPAVEVKYSASPLEAKIPFPVDFDATNSVSRIGAITEYRWDFDGDGTPDQTTNGPTVTHNYTVAGVYPTKLTVVTANGELTRSRATVTAKSIDVIFSEKPPVSSTNRNPHFAFTSNEPTATFECRLDVGTTEGTFEPCTSPVDYTDLPDQDYVLQVRGTVGADTGLPAVVPFRVDNINPVATITGQPSNPIGANTTTGQVSFEANENVTFECRFTPTAAPVEPVEGEEPPPGPQFQPCSSPADVAWQAIEGTNTFEVRPTDLAGNVGDIVTASWVVDTTPPVTTITSGPPNPTNGVGGAYSEACDGDTLTCILDALSGGSLTKERSTTGNVAQSFAFSANEAGSTFICQFNDGPERACITGVQTGTGVSGANNSFTFDEKLRRLGTPVQGVNTLKVWATDAVGNRAPQPTVRTYVYDSIAPVITALAKPADFTKTTQNTVIFQSNEPVVSFECRVINNTGTTTTGFSTSGNATTGGSGFNPCSPGMLNSTLGWYTAVGQTDGRKGLQVRATDPAGNVLTTNSSLANATAGALNAWWTVDNSLPTNSFAAGSQQEGSYTTSPNATINLAAADTPINFGTTANGVTAQQPTYECSFNNAAFTACTTPVSLTGLTPGAKSFRVQVKDAAGNLSAAPIERKWTVVGAANQSVTLNTTPPAVSGVRDNTYTFSPDNGTAECRIDPTETNNSAGTGWTACTSPKTFTGLADGNHQVEIRSAPGQVPAVHNFAVYANLPTVTVGGLPGIDRSGTRYTGLNQDSASITFTSPANPAYAPGATTFQCRYYESTAAVPPYEPCTSPYQVNWNKLNDGKTMRFEVLPVSSTGNSPLNPSTSNWTIQSTNPAVAFGKPAVSTACFNGSNTGPGAAGCVATADSTQPGLRSSVAAPRFNATTSKPISTAVAFACQLNGGTIQNPCTNRTSSITANTLTVLLQTSRGNNDNFGTAPTANATNTFKIWAVDLGGNMSDPIEYTWVQDTAPPTFAITSPTPARTNAGTVEKPLEFDILASEDLTSTGPGAVCRLIAGGTASTNGTSPGTAPATPASGWTACGGQTDARHFKYSNSSLAEGTYAVDVRGWDLGWNVATGTSSTTRPSETDNNANGRRYIFTIDRTAPTTNITGGPAADSTVGQKSASFTFATSEQASTAGSECRIDPADPEDLEGGWAPCASPYEVTDLADGPHTVQIRSWDTAGNYAVAPASRTWTIDTTPPSIELKSSIEDEVTKETSIVFGQLTDPADAAVECRLLTPADLVVPGEGEEAPAEVAWGTDCGSVIVPEEPPVEEPPVEEPPAEDPPAEDPDPFRYLTFENLTDGNYRFEIRATNGLQVTSDVTSFAWTVDTEAPDVEITSGPNAATKNTTAEFEFSSTDEGATFECAIDGGTAEACTSPVSYGSLGDGDHTVTVTATDEAGNVSDPAASRSWSVDTVSPVTSINSGPTGTVTVANASFGFTADKAGSTFECKLDSGDWAACTSPKAVSGLANGSHTISVRATDTLGNQGAGVDRTWTVNVPDPPDPTCEEQGKVGVYPDCYDPCTAQQTGTPPNCIDPCPVGTTGTPPNCQPNEVLAADLARVVVKGPKKAKRGKVFTVRAQVKNNGDAAASNVKVCLQTPKRLIAGKAKRCVTIKSIAPGATGTATFKVKGKKAAKKAKKAAKMTVSAPMGDPVTGLSTGKRIYKPILNG